MNDQTKHAIMSPMVPEWRSMKFTILPINGYRDMHMILYVRNQSSMIVGTISVFSASHSLNFLKIVHDVDSRHTAHEVQHEGNGPRD